MINSHHCFSKQIKLMYVYRLVTSNYIFTKAILPQHIVNGKRGVCNIWRHCKYLPLNCTNHLELKPHDQYQIELWNGTRYNMLLLVLHVWRTVCYEKYLNSVNIYSLGYGLRDCKYFVKVPLQWRHNEHDGVSNHQPHDCLLNRLFRRRSQKIKAPRRWPLCGEFTDD